MRKSPFDALHPNRFRIKPETLAAIVHRSICGDDTCEMSRVCNLRLFPGRAKRMRCDRPDSAYRVGIKVGILIASGEKIGGGSARGSFVALVRSRDP
jgi:hypothetical protein